MNIKHHISHRSLSIAEVSDTSIERIKRDILSGNAIEDDFRTSTAGLPAQRKTEFKIYQDGEFILIAVCLLDNCPSELNPTLDNVIQIADRDEIEIFFDLNNDRIGYYQFVFKPGKEPVLYHHLPYRDAHTTKWSMLEVKDFVWDFPDNQLDNSTSSLYSIYTDESWLFVRFAIDDIFYKDICIGFNIARNSPLLMECTSWNPSSGNGLLDANSFGKIYRHTIPCYLYDYSVKFIGSDIVIEGFLGGDKEEVVFNLLNPYGEKLITTTSIDNAIWTVTAKLLNPVHGRYRLVPNIAIEPECIIFDLVTNNDRADFSVGMLYDFADDLFSTKKGNYTSEMLKSEFKMLKNIGLDHLYWIDYDPASMIDNLCGNKRYTQVNAACDNVLRFAANFSKKNEMNFTAIIKTFDRALNSHFCKKGESTFLDPIEQKHYFLSDDLHANQSVAMASHPDWWQSTRYPITRVCLYSRLFIKEILSDDIELLISDNNCNFKPYSGTMNIHSGLLDRSHQEWTPAGNIDIEGKIPNGFIEISDLKLNSPYLAIRILKPGIQLIHRVFAFCQAWDINGHPVTPTPSSSGNINDGFSFWREWNGWANKSPRMLEEYKTGTLPFCLCFNRAETLPALLEPSADESHSFWLKKLEGMCKTDTDTISIRTLFHHNNVTDYMLYAYAKSVRDKFEEVYKRKVSDNWEDCIKIRTIRGKSYTEFLRKAKTLLSSYDKKLCLHIESGFEIPPDYDQRMQFNLEWKTLIEEKVVDEIIIKGWTSQSSFIHEKILPLARLRNIPVFLCDPNSTLRWNSRRIENAETLVSEAITAGFSGYYFYEMADYKYWNKEGRPRLRASVADALRSAVDVKKLYNIE